MRRMGQEECWRNEILGTGEYTEDHKNAYFPPTNNIIPTVLRFEAGIEIGIIIWWGGWHTKSFDEILALE